MDNNEAFEKWYKNSTNLLAHGAPVYHSLKDAWQAAQQQMQASNDNLIAIYARDCQTIDALKADNERLREAVAWQFYQDGKWHNGMETNNHKQNTIDAGFPVRELYASQSLQAHDNEVIERCAKLFETEYTDFPKTYLLQSAKAIRELKGKQ